MNLYQTLNREYREFRLKQSLKENEDPTVSAIADTLSESKESNEDELARRLVGLSDALNTATDPDEIKAIQAEIEEIKAKLNEIDGDNINDSEETDAQLKAISNGVTQREIKSMDDFFVKVVSQDDDEYDILVACDGIAPEHIYSPGRTEEEAIHGAISSFLRSHEREVPISDEFWKTFDECDKKEIKEAGANLDISAGVDIPDDLASGIGMALLASDEDGTSEATEETKEVEEGEPVSAVAKITELAGIPKEDIIKEIGAMSEEEKEALNSSLCTLKEVFDELCPKTDEVEEANAPQSEDVVQDCEATPIHEAEVASYKVVRVAPKVSAYMIEAQTKEGIKFITGKNFNENDKTLEEAEISDSKLDATNRFKSLLENK